MDWQWERSSSDLLQNCDLPPPLKLFSPFDVKDDVDKTKTRKDAEAAPANQNENSSLLRALQLSQSRAREAEKKAADASEDNKKMAALVLEESLRLSAHRRWMRILEEEILLMQKGRKPRSGFCEEAEREGGEDAVLAWCLTLAICVGIGVVFGRYMF
ncbi:uncharacterized protein LOC109832795 [Asparagus officinalis]|uniref:uncharacterized protein LOC109832795 n=1 Tax=Asparagus officinalis TaxID=4686 RepID=UPI00098E071E|nr:uncharacterized protein LOC109832795 [Asparagus officinalis]